jgi:hypothetical protein
MNETNATFATLDQTDEEILTEEVSDEALEAAAAEVKSTSRSCSASYPCCR